MKNYLLKKLIVGLLNRCLKSLLKDMNEEMIVKYQNKARGVVKIANNIVDALEDRNISTEEFDLIEEEIEILFSENKK